MIKKILVITIPMLLIVACTTTRLSSRVSFQELGDPPGTKKISNNLYIDRAEIRNLDYLEFLHWNKSVFGINSDEYRSILPDSNQWSKLNLDYSSLDLLYSKDPDFRLLSVVGVTNKQAKLFSKWRSDRVMEFILIQYKILKYQPIVSKESAFTIEKYFKGEYCNIKPNPQLQFYPEYKLLDSTENTITGFKNICTYKKWEQ